MRPIPRDDAAGQAAAQVPLGEAQHRETAASQDADQLLQLRSQQAKDRPGHFGRFVGAGDAVVIVGGQRQKHLFPGHLLVAGQALQAQAAELGRQRPTAGDILPAEGGQAERRGLPEQGEDARPLSQQAPRHRGGEFTQAQRHSFILKRLANLACSGVEKKIRTISKIGSGLSRGKAALMAGSREIQPAGWQFGGPGSTRKARLRPSRTACLHSPAPRLRARCSI